jgi:hypothetical protein
LVYYIKKNLATLVPEDFHGKKINASTTTPEAAAASNAIELKLFQTTTKAAVFRQSTLDKKQKA